jgi:LmbE family N-acetylglucosaminyl deacetylase
MVVLTDGAAGHRTIPPDELRAIRQEEARRAAESLGATPMWLAVRDESLFDDEPTRLLLVEALRKARPDLILAHHPEDYHPDHRAASHLAFSASFIATLPNVVTESPPLPVVPPLTYFDTFAGGNFVPQEFVDITDVLDEKLRLFGNHRSQVEWMSDHDAVDMNELITTVARFRGFQCGTRYAEAFAWEGSWPRRRSHRLLP